MPEAGFYADIMLACGHGWPGETDTRAEAEEFLALAMVTGDKARCYQCGTMELITGPLVEFDGPVHGPPEPPEPNPKGNYDAHVAKALGAAWKMAPPQFTKMGCIGATKVGIAVLKRFAVQAVPMPCGIWIGNEPAFEQLEGGTPTSEWPTAAYSIGVDPDIPPTPYTGLVLPGRMMPPPPDPDGWNGHLVIEGDGWIADLAAGQFARPEQRIFIGPWTARLGVDAVSVGEGSWGLMNEKGTYVLVKPRRELAAWRNAPDWRNEPPVALVDAMAKSTDRVFQMALSRSIAARAAAMNEQTSTDGGERDE